MDRLLVLVEGHLHDPHHGKTARGVIDYGARPVVALLDSAADVDELGGIPVVRSVADALAHHPTTALIGVATTGGRLPPAMEAQVREAISAGLDIESGMHVFLSDDAGLAALAGERGVELRDVRRPPAGLSTPTGENLTHDARVVLLVGSDCAIGKMTTALELDREARRRGERSVFVATGQTGIMISGWGIAVDAVVSDFVAGAAERLVVEGARRGDLLWVEGQGALLHPYYSGVTLGLYHGSAPHALVLQHKAGETHLDGLPDQPIPSLPALVELHERIALPARPCRVAALALNTRELDDAAARTATAAAERETGVVADDPVRFGAGRLLDAVLSHLAGL
jgi:uncharacterized NAD-dependent epimerase/dehydratase family protein